MKKITVIIPAYNEEKNIKEAIELLKKQDYGNFDIIVVDNNSKDNTNEIAKKTGVTVLLETKKGTNNALESGRRAATGEIIARMDADCLPEAWWLSRAAKHFDNEKVSGLTGPYDYYDSKASFRLPSLFIQKYIYFITNYLVQAVGLGAVMTGGNSFMRASSLEKVGGFDTTITFYGDDTDTAKKMSKIGKVVFDPGLTIKTSARRFQNEGLVKITYKYFTSFIITLFGWNANLKNK